jgi:hypothetical protein
MERCVNEEDAHCPPARALGEAIAGRSALPSRYGRFFLGVSGHGVVGS